MFHVNIGLLALAAAASFGSVHATLDDKNKVGNSTIDRTVQLRTHSVYAPYIDQDLQNRWWDFGADAYVNTNKHIRLTRAAPSQMGWLWSRLPLTSTNYVIEVEFKVGSEATQLFGDGLAMWLTSERAQPGPVFGSKDNFEGLGIFLDTYANARHTYPFPRISGMLGDGHTSYDFGADGDKTSLGGCSANFRRTNVATKLKITYLKDHFLDVKVQYKAWDDWSDCFHVDKIALPAQPFLGFSAMTGDVFDAHDIITVTTYSAILSAPDSPRDKIKKPAPGIFPTLRKAGEATSGTWAGFFLKLLLCGAVCGGGWFGYREWERRQRYGGDGGGGHGRGMSMGMGMGSASGFGGAGWPGSAGGAYSRDKRAF